MSYAQLQCFDLQQCVNIAHCYYRKTATTQE